MRALAPVRAPERDEKKYRRARCANGLEVLLIEDKSLIRTNESRDDGCDGEDMSEESIASESAGETDGESESQGMDVGEGGTASGGGMKLAACSIAFDVGYFDDPSECDGLSHFLEHMVFMGSEKFPGENYFGDWLNQHWGSENASTDSEATVFYFDVNPKNLREALEIFSGFFLSPLVKLDSVDREVTAVESEFERVVNNDYVRYEMLMSHVAREGHPFTKFGWGNRASLTQSAPYVEGRMRDVLLEHWRKHYHAKRMSLAVVGAEDLDTLQSWIEEIFGSMRSDGDDAIDLSVTQPSPYASVVPLRVLTTQEKDGQQIAITHELPAWTHKNYKSKSAAYVETLLGHEGHGSLFAELKHRGWASDLRAGIGAGGIDSSSACALMNTMIKLTDDGLAHVDDVIELFFAYINMLRANGPQEWFWKELKQLSDIDFRFREPEDASEYAERLVADIRKYAPEDVLRGADLFETYAPDEISQIIDLMTPKRALIVVQDHSWLGEGEGVESEPWIGFPYQRQALSEELLERWRNADGGNRLRYPAPNHYIAQDFELRSPPREHYGTLFAPSIVHECKAMRLWHRLDDRFNQPRACMYFQISLPNIPKGAFGMMLTQLFVAMTEDSVNESLYYPAHLAGMEIDIGAMASYSGVVLSLEGLSDKLGDVAVSYFQAMTRLQIEPERFEKRKEERLRDCRNLCLNPSKHAKRTLEFLLKQTDATQEEKVVALEAMTAQDLQAFADGVWHHAHVEGQIVGNLTQDEARIVGERIRASLPGAPIPDDAWPETRIAQVPRGAHLFSIKAINDNETNNVVSYYFQLGVSSWHERAYVILMQSLMHEKLFDQLRTKETLGYNVSCAFDSTHEILGFRIVVESAFHPPHFVSSRMTAFLKTWPETIEKISDAEYEKTRQSVIEEILALDVNLHDESQRHWAHIVNQKYQFYRGRHIAHIVAGISKQQAAFWSRENIQPFAPQSRLVSVHIHAKNHPVPEPGHENVTGMGDAYFEVSTELKTRWGFHPHQGDARVVEELMVPDASDALEHRTIGRPGNHLNEDTDSIQEKSASLRSQWAADYKAAMECGATCACRRQKKAPVFVLPTPKN